MNVIKPLASVLLLVFLCLSCDVEEVVNKFTGGACEALIDDLYDEYDDYIVETLNTESLTEDEKTNLIADYEETRDEKIQEVNDTCEEEIDIF
ncbi:hypothetical protein [Formosa sp. 4Alg 33]|uniref:hypothetical protein n=1 Tax=Formosa sp. 4Alg 33 TaxID=3382189 RepID=UPI003D9C4075